MVARATPIRNYSAFLHTCGENARRTINPAGKALADHDWSQTKVSEPVFEKLKKLRKQSIAAQQNIKSPCGRSPAAAWRRSGIGAGGGRIEGGTRGIRFPLPTRTFDV